ncbi:MAG: virulence factor [Gammaproteobacteria bacterium]|nr:virulence factor [Gammaproteobacteria bacterium]
MATKKAPPKKKTAKKKESSVVQADEQIKNVEPAPTESNELAEPNEPAEYTEPTEEAELFERIQKEDAIPIAQAVYQLWQGWGDFELTVLHPVLPQFDPPIIHHPEPIPDTTEHEFVYPIHDFGYRFLTSKQDDLFSSGKSMCKLYYTIEKIIAILVERLSTEGIDIETEVQVAFGGHELPQRKGFEIIINLKNNMVVTNFDPGSWGERYLKVVKNLSDLGYGYPSQTPRDIYKRAYNAGGVMKPK